MKNIRLTGPDWLKKENYAHILKIMRISVLILMLCVCEIWATSTYSQTKRLNLQLQDAKVTEVLDAIEKQSDFKFFYNDKTIETDKTVTLDLKEGNIIEVLDEVFEGTEIQYKIEKRQIALTLNKEYQKKKITVKGKVLDSDGLPIPGVNIMEKGTTNGTPTDVDGSYTIDVSSENAVLVFTFIGYSTKEMPLNGKTSMEVVMESSDSELDEVVVVAYGTQKKSNLTGSVTNIKAKELQDISSPNVSNLLQGKAAGVYVSSNSGRPGQGVKIRIRGKGSLNSSVEPLWVIDGVVGGTGAHLNPNDVESMTVLKDASATALYGSRAANGVILVTTKRGKKGASEFTFSTKRGFSKLYSGNFGVMNSQELYDYQSTFINNLDENKKNTDTDWFGEATEVGVSENHTFSYNGGLGKIRSYIMGDYYRETGAVSGYEMERYSTRVNLDYEVSKKVSLSTKIAGTYFTDDDKQRSIGSAYLYMPWDKPYNEDGTVRTGKESDWSGRDGSNYLYDLQWNWGKSRNFGIDASFNIKWEILPFLTFESTNNIGLKYNMYKKYVDINSIGGESDKGSLKNQLNSYKSRFSNQLLKYSKTFDEHAVQAFLGYEFSDYFYEGFAAEGKGIPSGKEVLDVTAEAKAVSGNMDWAWAMESYLFNANYTYKNRYMAQFSFRRDGSSKFGKDSRYGNFSTVSAGWTISNEEFMNDLEWLNVLKLRASYGSVGNTPGNAYASQGLYDIKLQYYGNPGAFPNQLRNDELTWEKSYSTNVALDMRVFDRLSLNIDFYDKNTSDLLYYRKLSNISGYSGKYENIGAVNNKGVEFTLKADILETEDFKWYADLNIGFNKNEITELADGKPQIVGHKRWEEGEDMDTWYLRKWMGVDAQTGKPQWEKINEDGTVELTSDYNQATRQMMGTSSPDYYGGLTTRFVYKDFELSANIAFTQGLDIYHSARELFDSDGAYPTFNSMKLKDGWSRWEKAGDNATHPQSIDGGNSMSNKPSSRYIEDGSFVKLRNVSFIYNLPNEWLNKVKINSASLFVTGDNLMTFTDFSGIDPEIHNNGSVGSGAYPLTKKIVFGVNIKF